MAMIYISTANGKKKVDEMETVMDPLANEELDQEDELF